MENKGVTLTVKEQKRLNVMSELDGRRVTGCEAADVLGVSLRHVWRLLAAFREEGAAGLAHGNRGREPVNKTPQATRERILVLAEERYFDYNDSHFTEKLNRSILGELNQISFGMISDTTIKGRYMLRAGNVNHRSQKQDFEFLVNEVKKIGGK